MIGGVTRITVVAVGAVLLLGACGGTEETTTTAATTTIAATTTTTIQPTTTTIQPTTTTTEALASSSDFAEPSDFAELILSVWDNRQVEGEPDEVIFHFLYDALVRDSNFADEALEPAEALEAGETYCMLHEIWIDTLGIDESVTNTIQSIDGMQAVYTRVRESHAFMIAISAAGGLCGRDVWRSTADSFLAVDNG